MNKRVRQYVGLLSAVIAYYLLHEGAHLLYALSIGAFKQINLMGLGMQIDIYAEKMTQGLYKSATFVIQAITFKQTGKYIRSQSDLFQIALPEEQRIINTSTYLKNGGAIDFEKMSQELFVWSKAWIGKAY